MKRIHSILLVLWLCIICIGCRPEISSPKHLVGVSQCSDDAWRRKMNVEMEQELILHPDLQLYIRHANDDSELQCAQIDSFITEQVDLLIVCPNEAEEVKPAVSRAYDAGIPVIIADRQVTGEKYTAFIGGDNYAVGQHMASWLIDQAAIYNRHLQVPLLMLCNGRQSIVANIHPTTYQFADHIPQYSEL